jgi:membrane protein YdbS with pleckstrin-like domain
MPFSRKLLNSDEELLAELRPHWIFLFGPLITSIATWVVLIVIVVLWQHAPGWTNYPIIVVALIPGIWLLGRYVRWRSYIIAITSNRIFVRQGILGRDTVQLRLQRVTELNTSQSFIERMLGVGRIIIDVQGEDDSMVLEYVRRPAVVQRVLNSLINELVGGGHREEIPPDMLPFDQRQGVRRGADDDRGDDGDHDDRTDGAHDTPPFGLHNVPDDDEDTAPGASTPSAPPVATTPPPPPVAAPPAAAPPAPPQAAASEIRDRLIELDDLRRRGIISEEEFAAKKSQLLDRI